MAEPFLMVDNAGNYKSFDFSPWGGIDGFLEMSKQSGATGSAYKARVPDLLRAVDMTATAVATLPFDICDEADEVVDSSMDWENVMGGMPNPQRLIYLIASSLCGGAAYVIPSVTSRAVFDLQYVAPQNITPQWRGNEFYFDRNTGTKTERIEPKDLLYFWLPDSDVELGPALSYPLGAATAAAGLTLNMGTALTKISERGFIPPTIMGVDGMTLPGEKERVEKWWNSFLRGAFAQIAKIVNAQKVTITQVGAGMEQLKGTYVELKREAAEDVAKAFGIPSAIFMSDKAYATEYNALIKQWYSNSIFTTIYHTIEETFTDQLLKPFGWSMYFRPESIDAFQEDENERGQAVGTLTSAIDTNPKVAFFVMEHILGYELSEEAESMMEEIITEKKEQQEREAEMAQQELEYNDPANQPAPVAAKPKPAATRSISLTPPMITDLKTWCDMAKRFYGKGKQIPVDFECKALPDELAAPIRDRLRTAGNELDIIKAFEISDMVTELADSDELKNLTDAINRATDAPQPTVTRGTEEMIININNPQNVDVTSKEALKFVTDLTANIQHLGAAIKATPPPLAPIVNVNVEPTPVTVQNKNDITVQPAAPAVNNITVEPADVILPKPSSATIIRDARDKITGIKTEGEDRRR